MDSSSLKKKRPPNAFVLYCNSIREQVKQEHPEIAQKELMQLLSQRYRNESKEVLDQYKEIAFKMQDEFNKQNPDYSYKRSSMKKQPVEVENDPVKMLNKSFKTNAFTLQCLTNQQLQADENSQ